MAILRINASEDGRVFPASGGDWRAELSRIARRIPATAPVVVMLHGLRYSWREGRGCDPHATLYRADVVPESRTTRPPLANWPRQLGFSEHCEADGLCIAFGWDAGELSDLRRMSRAKERFAAGLSLVLDEVADAGFIADVFGHSLGGAVALSAISSSRRHRVRRAVLMGPADRRASALLAMERSERTEFFHILARANNLFDEAFDRLSPGSRCGRDAPLGAMGPGRASGRWIDIQIDHPRTKRWLSRRAGAPPRRPERVSHWVYYSDPTAMAFYSDVLRYQGPSAIAAFKALGAPLEIEPRWARLRPKFVLRSTATNASSTAAAA